MWLANTRFVWPESDSTLGLAEGETPPGLIRRMAAAFIRCRPFLAHFMIWVIYPGFVCNISKATTKPWDSMKKPNYFFDKIYEFNSNYNFFDPNALNRILKGGDIQKIWYIYNLSSWHLSRMNK